MIWDRISRALVALFFIALLAVGLNMGKDYGLPCDETTEQVILEENMLEYAIRLWGEDSDAAQYYLGRGITPASQSIERDHGQSPYYPVAGLLTLRDAEPDRMTTLWHAYTWLWFMVGVGALYGFCRQTGLSRPVSCMGMLLLYLCPRFFAEGHYNSKDMVLLTLVLCTLWLGARLLQKPGFLRGLCFSLAGAIAFNVRVVGLLPWALMGLFAIVLLTARRAWSPRMVWVALTTVVSFAGFYALLTPAMLSDPLYHLRYLLQNASGFTRWPGVVLFRGMRFEHAVNPLPRYYLLWMMAITLPMYVLPLAAVGQLYALVRVWKQKLSFLRDPVSLSLTATSLCWFLPLFFAVLTRPLVYNGWRHFYFAYAGVAVLAAHGTGAIIRLLRKRTGEYGMHRVFAAGLCLYFAWTASDISKNHPYQYAYYNRLAHRSALSGQMELDYWVVSSQNALETLLTCERDETLALTVGARDDMNWIGVERSYGVLSLEDQAKLEIAYDPDANYLVYNTTYAAIYDVSPPRGYRKLFTLTSYDVPICTVYEKRQTN